MLYNIFLRAVITATFCLMGSVSAAISVDDSTQTTETYSVTSRRAFEPDPVAGNIVKSCGTHISVCGAEDEDNVIYVPRSTETETNEIHTTSIKVLKPTTTTVTEISVSTIIQETKGKTVIAAGPPVKVTVDVVIVSVQEVQDVDTVTETIVSTTSASVVEQCFLETHTVLGGVPGSWQSGSPTDAIPYLSSTQTASPAGFTADFDQFPSDESTPKNMAGGLDGYGMYEQGSEE
ncbi:hypothetical protein FPOAC1_003605 [Fusarium poae]|uniref:hypothetical protein n=1 Tax=Fusarium poae TaxID=36050 RepID=UPI001CE90219|nr:hypothetical protein FPOAC1_003605 [Fusarium poae]KAG8677581.1 hypothetical protein FPOAC1_003605 [Fusarium poae]